METIKIKGENGFINMIISNKHIEIQSGNFFAEGEVNFDNEFLINLKKSFEKCLNNKKFEHTKLIISTKNNLFGIEFRTDGDNDFVLLIGLFREREINGNILDFELIIKKEEIKQILNNL